MAKQEKSSKIWDHFSTFFDFFQMLSRTWGINLDTIACVFELVDGLYFLHFFFFSNFVPDLGDQFWYNRLCFWAGRWPQKMFLFFNIFFPKIIFSKYFGGPIHSFPTLRSGQKNILEIFIFSYPILPYPILSYPTPNKPAPPQIVRLSGALINRPPGVLLNRPPGADY